MAPKAMAPRPKLASGPSGNGPGGKRTPRGAAAARPPATKKKIVPRTVTRGANQVAAQVDPEEEQPQENIDPAAPVITFTPGKFVFDNPGRKITDDYDCNVADQLGEGGYGTVFRASIKGNPDAVRAVKKIRKELIKSLRALKQEIEVMKGADHPNIVKFYESYEDSKHIYLVMEICEGGELFDRIIESGHFTEEQTARCMRQLLRAIRYLHDQRIAHRDLKPENLIFVKNKPPDQTPMKLIDFGLAETIPVGKHLKDQKGSLYYMAPEILKRRYGIEVDIWSCGVIMFIMLSGYPPFCGDDDDSTYAAITKDPLVFRDDYWAERPDDMGGPISADAMDFIRVMCERDIKKRWTAAQCSEHPWIERAKPPFKSKITVDYLKRLASYLAPDSTVLKRAAYQLIINRLSEREVKEYKDLFLTLDVDGDGYIIGEEVAMSGKLEGLHDAPEMKTVLELFGSTRMTYTEFMAAVSSKEQHATDNNIASVFRVFDRKLEGRVTEEVLQKIFGDDASSVFREAKQVSGSTDKEGFLDLEDFRILVLGGAK
mmetsp:Transcript_56647/g.151107  ORF Transcript_56647/g.151107 Transcript_56647/m.151107 type:complete len:544 (-) Transcript_56647:144-1775(-)